MIQDVEIRDMSADDYTEVIRLWRHSEGIGLSGADSRENIEKYLERNPGLSAVVRYRGDLIGAILCGHDGRRGYIHHLAVAKAFRRKGIARKLVDRSLERLRELGIQKVHCFVFEENEDSAFWKATGWLDRADLRAMSRNLAPNVKPPDDRPRYSPR